MIRRRDNPEGRFAVIAEFVEQGPILMESEDLSYAAAYRRAEDLKARGGVIRVCMVRLTYEGGNAALCPPEPVEEVTF